MKYVLFDDSDKLHGYVIFEREKSKNLCYFDLGQNKVFQIASANVRMVNGMLASYSFYKDGDKNIMVNYIEQNHKPCLQFIELIFSNHLSQELFDLKEVEGIFIDKIVDEFFYLHHTHELYYYNYYDREDRNARLVNIDTFEMKKLFSEDAFTPYPVDFIDGKYLALGPSGIFFYDEDKIETIYDHSSPFIEGSLPLYSAVLKKVKYSSMENRKNTIKIFDVENMQIIDTGIRPMEYDRVDSDKDKFHFLGEQYILYARYKKGASSLAKSLHRKKAVLSRFLNPVEYVIYDYVNKKEIGYVENCQLNAVYDFFPEVSTE